MYPKPFIQKISLKNIRKNNFVFVILSEPLKMLSWDGKKHPRRRSFFLEEIGHPKCKNRIYYLLTFLDMLRNGLMPPDFKILPANICWVFSLFLKFMPFASEVMLVTGGAWLPITRTLLTITIVLPPITKF